MSGGKHMSRNRFKLCLNPSPPGLLAHPWVPGGAYHAPPLLSREPLFVECRARRHSKALDKKLQNHLSELKIEVTCKVKVRSKVKIRRFDLLGPGDQDYRTWWLKLRHNVFKGMVNPRPAGGGGGRNGPPSTFPSIAQKRKGVGLRNFREPLPTSILHMLTKGKFRTYARSAVSDVRVTSCSAILGQK